MYHWHPTRYRLILFRQLEERSEYTLWKLWWLFICLAKYYLISPTGQQHMLEYEEVLKYLYCIYYFQLIVSTRFFSLILSEHCSIHTSLPLLSFIPYILPFHYYSLYIHTFLPLLSCIHTYFPSIIQLYTIHTSFPHWALYIHTSIPLLSFSTNYYGI